MAATSLRDPEFLAWLKLPRGHGYRDTPLWSYVGRRQLDHKLTSLADLYRNSTPERQRQIHKFFEGQTPRLNELDMYVRRVAKLIRSRRDGAWLRRGLAIAALVGSRVDYRDCIVSLVILRFGAERAGIRTRAFFEEALPMAAAEDRGILENARDHRKGDVEYTIRTMGPPEWGAELENGGRRRESHSRE
jgi:hypothetical protein